jgi:alpha-amylase
MGTACGAAARFGDLLHDFRAGRHAELKPFVQGGFYRNFLRKYAEANQLHKRMLHVSDRVEACGRLSPSRARAARDFLYRAQANDVYWHGVFGGLYLNHLREAAWSNLLRAEGWRTRSCTRGRRVGRGHGSRTSTATAAEELLLKTAGMTLLSHAHDGRAVTEISLPARGVALGPRLTRARKGTTRSSAARAARTTARASIHDMLVLKAPAVLDALGADPWQRASFREAFHGEGDSPEAILSGAPPLCVTAGKEALVECARRGTRLVARFEVPLAAEGVDLLLEKVLVLRGWEEGFTAAFRLRNRGERTVAGTLCSEWNLNMLSGEGVERYYEGLGDPRGLSSSGASRDVREFRVVDGWRNVAARAVLDRDCAVLRRPVETASLSEAGAEKIHQGICIRILFPVSLPPGKTDSYSVRWLFYSIT